MKNICIVTATRAEYGILKPIIKKISLCQEMNLELVVTGTHLSPEFGLTYTEILEDGFEISEKIENVLSSDTPSAISKSMGITLISFSDYLKRKNIDLIVLLGDRYEIFAVAIAAANEKIPIAHLHGGEITEGALDESYRHAISKLSTLHLTSTEEYKHRVMQLGESPYRVHNVGSLGVENVKNESLMTKEELETSLNIPITDRFAIVTFHPETLSNALTINQIEQLLEAIKNNNDFQYIFTKANSDSEGRLINMKIEEFVKDNDNCFLFSSLGMKRYLSLLQYATFVLGNSSSGIIEVPSFKIPTIDIGNRQKGRVSAKSVHHVNCVSKEIDSAIKYVQTQNFRLSKLNGDNPYEGVETSEKILKIFKSFLSEDRKGIKKTFYDWSFSE